MQAILKPDEELARRKLDKSKEDLINLARRGMSIKEALVD
jgi:hypothetical protein